MSNRDTVMFYRYNICIRGYYRYETTQDCLIAVGQKEPSPCPISGGVAASLGPLSGMVVSGTGAFFSELSKKNTTIGDAAVAASLSIVGGKSAGSLSGKMVNGFKKTSKINPVKAAWKKEKAYWGKREKSNTTGKERWYRSNRYAKAKFRTRSYMSSQYSGLFEFVGGWTYSRLKK